MMLVVALGIALGFGPPSEPAPPKFAAVTLAGTVVELPAALKPLGLPADGPLAHQVVLKGADGALTPLLYDDASRALFEDGRLRDRRAEIVGRRYEGMPFVQVTSFKVDDQGTLRTPEYYCDVCSISVKFPQACPCCQGDMVLRMKPEGR